MSRSVELDFWLAYCEQRGAAFEDRGESILMVLTAELQREHSFGEEVMVTANPEVAREDGAVLLLRGHPALESAAEAVLDAGDVGVWPIGWPPGHPLDHIRLLDEARRQFPVDHGRLDLEGRIDKVQQPVLRIGALVTYTVGDRFQEQLELCLDAVTGLPVADDLGRRLLALPRGDSVWTGGSRVEYDLGPIADRVSELVGSRARARLLELASQQAIARQEAEEQAAAYYDATLGSLTRRREAAPPDRRPAYDAKLKATEAERARRLAEIAGSFAGRYEVRPFRAHLVLAPALAVPAVVRRGDRRWPLGLRWLLDDAQYMPVACPGCGSRLPLVAGRDRLGCRGCLTPKQPGPAAAPPSGVPPPSGQGPAATPMQGPPTMAPGGAGIASPPRVRPARRDPAAPGAGQGGSVAPAPRRPASVLPVGRSDRSHGAAHAAGRTPEPAVPPGRGTARAPAHPAIGSTSRPDPIDLESLRSQILRHRERVGRDGMKLAHTLWEAALNGDPLRGRQVMSPSPLRSLYALYGWIGPLVVIGISPRDRIVATSTSFNREFVGCVATSGLVETAQGRRHPFTLLWSPGAERPLAGELLPFGYADRDLMPRFALTPATIDRLHDPALRARGTLDPVTAAIIDSDLAACGLPMVLRALAAWAAAGPVLESEGIAPQLAAAALTMLASRSAGLRGQTLAVVAERHGVGVDEVRPLIVAIRRSLRAQPSPWW